MSSINNVSKHSFEELEKLEGQPHYLRKPPGADKNFDSLPAESKGSFNFLGASSASQPQPPSVFLDASAASKDKEDTFEEVSESKEIVEDRVNRIKMSVIEATMKQQELSARTASLEKDIEILQLKLEDTAAQQQRAVEGEDFEEADALNMRLSQTKSLIASKEAQIKRLDEDYMAIENKKSDKYRELSALVRRSLAKMGELREKQQLDMAQFEESEANAVEAKRKRLHYESIRVDETAKDLAAQRERVNQRLLQIEEQVFEATRPQQAQKQQIEAAAEALEREIAEIEALLESKRGERATLERELQAQEAEIDKARARFKDQIGKSEQQLEKVGRDEDKNARDAEELLREQQALAEYEETYKARVEGFRRELRELEEFEKQLRRTGEAVDGSLGEKEQWREQACAVKQETHQLRTKRENALASREFSLERLARVDAEAEELQLQVAALEKRGAKLEQEKAKAVALKKFKEAKKAQDESKDVAQQVEEARERLADVLREKEAADLEIAKKEAELRAIDEKLREGQERFERVQLRLLSFRKEDILDLLQSLRQMAGAQNAQKKAESLQAELDKIDNELFELEKKYGEIRIRRPKEAETSLDSQDLSGTMPAVESSRMAQPSEPPTESELPNIAPRRRRRELEREAEELERRLKTLEAMIEEAVSAEDYDRADQCQTDIDRLHERLAGLRQEATTAPEDEDDAEEGEVADLVEQAPRERDEENEGSRGNMNDENDNNAGEEEKAAEEEGRNSVVE